MKKAKVFVNDNEAGILTEIELGKKYTFEYLDEYNGSQVSLTLPVTQKSFGFETFPPFFDGLLPEGFQLEGLLKFGKIDRNDLFTQLIAVGNDLVGNVTLKEIVE